MHWIVLTDKRHGHQTFINAEQIVTMIEVTDPEKAFRAEAPYTLLHLSSGHVYRSKEMIIEILEILSRYEKTSDDWRRVLEQEKQTDAYR
jgi:hypothetical protein